MARNLKAVKSEEKAKRGTEQRFLAGDLNAAVVFDDTYRDILSRTSTESAKFYLGAGARTTRDPNAGYMYADLVASGAGAGAAGDDINGVFRFVVYADSEREVPIVGSQVPSREMREAVAESRRERPALPLHVPGAGKDKAIAVQYQSDATTDGYEIDPGASDVSIPYVQILE